MVAAGGLHAEEGRELSDLVIGILCLVGILTVPVWAQPLANLINRIYRTWRD